MAACRYPPVGMRSSGPLRAVHYGGANYQVEANGEIVVLAARGLSNKDIAERLTVSVRTIEGHLYRAGLKLGVSERTALAHVLGIE